VARPAPPTEATAPRDAGTGEAREINRPTGERRKGASPVTGGPDQLRFAILAVSDRDQQRRSWQDGEGGRVERFIQEIAVEVVTSAEVIYRENCIRAFEWRVRRKHQLEQDARQHQLQREREQQERQRELEQARIDRLLDEAASLRRATDIGVRNGRLLKPIALIRSKLRVFWRLSRERLHQFRYGLLLVQPVERTKDLRRASEIPSSANQDLHGYRHANEQIVWMLKGKMVRPGRRHGQSGRFGGARGLVPQRHRGDRRRHREAQLSQVRAFFFGDCSFFFIDCFDRIVSQFLQLRQEYTSPAFDSLSCLVKNLVRAGGHGGYLRRGRLCLCQGGFCQCADAIKDLPGVEAAFTRELLPVPSIEVIAPALAGDFLCEVFCHVLPNLAAHEVVYKRN
jgi:hypothetical protein